MKTFIIFFIFLLFISFSCTKEVPYPNVNSKKYPVISAFINQNGIKAKAIWSNSVNEKFTTLPIENAIIKLFENDNLIGELQHNSNGTYTYSGFTPTEGAEYNITINIPEQEELSAKTIMPYKVIPNENYMISQNYNGRSSVFQIFKDPEEQTNYYLSTIRTKLFKDKSTIEKSIEIYGYEAGESNIFIYINDNNLGCLFNDNLFNGRTYYYKATINDYDYRYFYENYQWETENIFSDSAYIIPHLRSINYDMYKYYYDSYLQNLYAEDPFSNNYPVHSNITNGYGIFGAYYDYAEDTLKYIRKETNHEILHKQLLQN